MIVGKTEKTAQEIEQEKWHTWNTSFMTVPSMYEEENNHGGCCQCVPCCDCCQCCKCCQCCAPCLCALHPLGILRGALAPFIKLIRKVSSLYKFWFVKDLVGSISCHSHTLPHQRFRFILSIYFHYLGLGGIILFFTAVLHFTVFFIFSIPHPISPHTHKLSSLYLVQYIFYHTLT